MPQYVVSDTELTAVANAIRTKGGTNGDLEWPSGFVSAIGDISGGNGNGNTVIDEAEIKNTSGGTFTFSKSATIQKSGQYKITAVSYANNLSITVNGVSQPIDIEASTDYLRGYSQTLALNAGDIVEVSSSGTGKCLATVSIVDLDGVELVPKTITQNGTYNASDDNADGYSSVTVNVSGGDNDEILYNPDFSKNTTGQTSWDGTNSGTSQSSRFRIIDGWEIMQCTAEKTANGLKVVPKKQYAYLTATIPAYWFLNKTVTIYAIVNGTKYEMTGALSSHGASVSYNTPFGQLYFYAYSAGDIVFTVSFYNQIDQEFVISDTSMKLSTS